MITLPQTKHSQSHKVTRAAADAYNLNVVDCNASVTVARWSSISASVSGGSGGYPQPPEANLKGHGSTVMVSVASPRPVEIFYGKRSFSVTTPPRPANSRVSILNV